MERINQHMRLADGRTLGFAEFGSAEGIPVVYFHGWPSSRLEAAAMHDVGIEMGFRIIAPDRPGFGLSDFHPGRRFLDFTNDVSQLADHLGLDRFTVLGISGGGPYAVAGAFQLPDRLTATLLVCSVGPSEAPNALHGMVAVNRCLLAMARRFPRLAERIAGICLRVIWRKGHQVIPKQIEVRLSPPDQRALASQELRQALTAGSVEALRQGVRGAAAEGLLYARPWGFSLKEIRARVFLWHGEMDVVVPVTMGRYLAENIPTCRALFCPQDGHFSLPFTRMREILNSAIL